MRSSVPLLFALLIAAAAPFAARAPLALAQAAGGGASVDAAASDADASDVPLSGSETEAGAPLDASDPPDDAEDDSAADAAGEDGAGSEDPSGGEGEAVPGDAAAGAAPIGAIDPSTAQDALATPRASNAPLDPRPEAAAYTVIGGVAIPAPLAGLSGDADRGREVFSDLDAGGCIACHAAPGLPRVEAPPRILSDRLPPLPPPETEEEAGDEADGGTDALADEAGAAPASDSRLAPESMPLPPFRPDAEAQAAVEEAPAEASEDAALLLPLPVGPDLAGVGARLSSGELRLIVVNPRILHPHSRMPAYHHISESLGSRLPGLRQPWLSPQQVEDVVAWLESLRAAE